MRAKLAEAEAELEAFKSNQSNASTRQSEVAVERKESYYKDELKAAKVTVRQPTSTCPYISHFVRPQFFGLN